MLVTRNINFSENIFRNIFQYIKKLNNYNGKYTNFRNNHLDLDDYF